MAGKHEPRLDRKDGKMGQTMKLRLCATLVTAITVFVGLGFQAASASAASRPVGRFASEATAYQNKVIEGALARVPGGIRVSASQARWPAYKIGLGVPRSPAQDPLQECLDAVPELDFCAFTQVNYQGNYVYAWNSTGDLWVPWGQLQPNQGTHSWYNALGTRVWREQFQNHGNELCIDPWPYGNYTDSNYSGPNLYDYWILLTTNENRC
jgi:hypothetical protein